MLVEPTEIPAVKVITPRRFGDHRGFFSEVYNKRSLADEGVTLDFVQDNHSMSGAVGTLRGLHFQYGENAQDKLVRVARGRILDVAVDVRVGSPTFGKHVAVELSAENWKQLLVPIGFAHAFVTLEPDTEVLYKCSAPYDAEHEGGIVWNDPDLAIDWPIEGDPVLSEKDAENPLLKDLPEYFRYDG